MRTADRFTITFRLLKD